MEVKKTIHRMSIGEFATHLKESTANGQRFCFILGSGASVTSGIPMGRMLEKRWMDCLMGVSKDGNSPAKDPTDTERVANKLYAENIIETPFEKLKAAWENSKKPGGYIPSEYYFDIYKLRFYPERRNGYKYLEQLMEKAKPSVGYHPLARLLAEDNGIDIIITTNFDSLTEDALFIFTDERPLVVAHESLAAFIDLSKNQRPVVAKVHRGLFYGPLNEKESTSELSEGWKDALGKIFMQYTPIVIGYAGGDRSLMSFLEERSTWLEKGLYWCLMKDEKPEERIENLVSAKGGSYVVINGFDDAMLTIGKEFLGESLIPTKTIELLNKNAKERGEEYDRQWTEWEKRRREEKAGHDEAIAKLTDAEKKEEEKREEKGELTAEDYVRRGNRAQNEGRYEDAISDYNKAIELKPDYSWAYNNRGISYKNMGEYVKAIEDYTKAIELKPDYAEPYYNRGNAYDDKGEYSKAIEDYTKAIELRPDYARAYNNRGIAYKNKGEYDKAIEDYTKAIELKPDYAEAYYNRGIAYDNMGDYPKAMEDYNKAIELKPDDADAYNNRGVSYKNMGEYAKAMEDYNKAIELKPDYADAYYNRGISYKNMGEYAKAIEDYNKAIEFDPNDPDYFRNRAIVYDKLRKKKEARADRARADELEKNKKA